VVGLRTRLETQVKQEQDMIQQSGTQSLFTHGGGVSARTLEAAGRFSLLATQHPSRRRPISPLQSARAGNG
jgi:hypothetical protein